MSGCEQEREGGRPGVQRKREREERERERGGEGGIDG